MVTQPSRREFLKLGLPPSVPQASPGGKMIWFMYENPWDPALSCPGYPCPAPSDQAIFRVSGAVAMVASPIAGGGQGIGLDADDAYVESDAPPVPGSSLRGDYPSCTFTFDFAEPTTDGYRIHGMVVNATQRFFYDPPVQVEIFLTKIGGRVVSVRFLFGPTQLLGFGYVID
jgi:hypothetical protein